MVISVKDSVRLAAARETLEVTRTIVVSGPMSPTVPRPVRFTIPDDAKIGTCSHPIGASPPTGHQRAIEIQVENQECDDVDETVSFSFSLPTECVGGNWRLSGRSYLADTATYQLDFELGRPVNTSSWRPDPFLARAIFDPDKGTATLNESGLTGPFVVDLAVAFRFRDPVYSSDQIDKLLEEMPTLNGQAQRRDGIFSGFRVITLLHFLTDLLPFMRALELRGLNPMKALALFKDYPYTYGDRVRATLEARGFQTGGPVTSATDGSLTRSVREFLSKGDEPIIVIEDGGYLLPSFHENADLKPFQGRLRGVVEQTTYGARVAEDLLRNMQANGREPQLACPLISVARSEAKMLYEPAFVAEAACNNVVRKLAGLSWYDAGVLLVGYGAIGSAIFSTLFRNHARVAVCDPSPLRLLLARRDQAHFVASSVAAAVAEFGRQRQKLSLDYVVGTTGHQSVSVGDAIAMSAWSPTLVSVSSKRVEFNIEGFESRAERKEAFLVQERQVGTVYSFGDGSIKVLGDGYPINFVSSESVPNQHIDPIMTLLHVCAAELAKPAVLLRTARFVGEADAEYPGMPKSRLSHDVVQEIIQQTDLFRPLMSRLAVPEA